MDIRTLYLVVGIVYLVVPLSMYLSTRNHREYAVMIWIASWFAMGLGAFLVGLRGFVADWVSFIVAHVAFMFAYVCRTVVMKIEGGYNTHDIKSAIQIRIFVAIVYLSIFLFMLVKEVNFFARQIFVNTAQFAFFAEFTIQALYLYRVTQYRGAVLITVMGIFMSLGFAVRVLGLIYDPAALPEIFYPGFDHIIILLCALIGFVIRNFGFFQLQSEKLSAQKERVSAKLSDAEKLNEKLRQILLERNANLKRVATMTNASGLGMMAGALTHELSQPLTSIRLNLSFLDQTLRKKPQTQEAQQALEEVRTESERLYLIVSHLRSFFQRGSTRYEPVNLANLLDSVILILDPLCADTNIRITKKCDPSVNVVGDGVLLQSLFLNLIRNAVDAIVQSHIGKKIDINVTARGDTVQIEILDDGPGFPSSVQYNEVEIFAGDNIAGCGIGMWLCHAIVESHSGVIRWQPSKFSSGVSVVINLPRHQFEKSYEV